MSRVLLFVQTGAARPKCIGEYAPQEMRYADRQRRTGTRRQNALKLAADRWWLVECENAEAGRATIEHVTLDDNAACPINCACCGGRILASGGRRA